MSFSRLSSLTSSVPFRRLSSPFIRKKIPLHLSRIDYCSVPSSPTTSSSSSLNPSEEELIQVNLLIPRLCQSNNITDAIRLLEAFLLIHPTPPDLAPLIDRLTEEPDLTHSMALLTRLSRNARARPHLLSVVQMLAAAFFEKQRPKEAAKVFNWILRPDSPCGGVDECTYRVVLLGFCRNRRTLEALKTLRRMLGEGMVPGEESREWIVRSMLWEARVREAMELDAALLGAGKGDVGYREVAELIDRMLGCWKV